MTLRECVATWKQGWCVLGRVLWFNAVLGFMLLPLAVAATFLGPIFEKSPLGEQQLFQNGRLNWIAALLWLAWLVWAPFAFRLSAEFTGEFRRDEDSHTPTDSPASGGNGR
jgi:hypothetical protein